MTNNKNTIKLFGFALDNSRDKVLTIFDKTKGNYPIKVLRDNDKLDVVLEKSLDLLVMYASSLNDSFLTIVSTEDLDPEKFDKIRKEYVATDRELRSLLYRLDNINSEMGKSLIANVMINSFIQDLYIFDAVYISPIRCYLVRLELY